MLSGECSPVACGRLLTTAVLFRTTPSRIMRTTQLHADFTSYKNLRTKWETRG